MDNDRFDKFTKALAKGTSRRRVLKGLAGTAFAGLLGVPRKSAAKADVLRERIAIASENGLVGFPSPPHNPLIAEIHALLVEGTGARGWDYGHLEDFVYRVEALRSEIEGGESARASSISVQAKESCTARCKRERDACILNDCGPGTTWPCFCCVPCNLTWAACLAQCIMHGEQQQSSQ